MSEVIKIQSLLSDMWKDYINLNPEAKSIHDLFISKGETVVNDHIALRTFSHPKTSIEVLAKPFLDCGYVEKDDYEFIEKKLYAKHYEHSDTSLPKVFISELLYEKLSEKAQVVINSLIDQIDDEFMSDFSIPMKGRPWDISSKLYNFLKEESEYASWMAAWGFRPNHFTVFINKLTSFDDVEDINVFIKENNFNLNTSGGEVKGSKEVYLKQSSTLAYNHSVSFSDRELVIPSCYYEFAKRFTRENGELYNGFVAKSADKIFESTDKGQ